MRKMGLVALAIGLVTAGFPALDSAAAQPGGTLSAEGAPSDIMTVDGVDVLPVMVTVGEGRYAIVSFRIPPTDRTLAEAAALCAPPLRLRFSYRLEATSEGGVYVLDEATCVSALGESPLPSGPATLWRPPPPRLLLAGPTFALLEAEPSEPPQEADYLVWQIQQRSSGTWNTLDEWDIADVAVPLENQMAGFTARFEFRPRCMSDMLRPDISAPGVSIRSSTVSEEAEPEFTFRSRVRVEERDSGRALWLTSEEIALFCVGGG